MKKTIRYVLFLVLITPICFEIALRILGYTGYQQVDYTISSEPNFCLTASSELGFALGEGVYEVNINGGPNYAATHVDGKRITRKSPPKSPMSKVFVMGCSFTYGMGVSDSLSFPYVVQSHFGDSVDIQNFGVPGFGNVQSYLQLKSEVERGNVPGLVIVNFCDFHHERNSLTPGFRNTLVMGYQRSNKEVSKELAKSTFPFIENGKLKKVAFKDLYSNWPGRETFAAVQYLQSNNDERLTSKIDLEKNSLAIFKKMKAFCDQHKIELLVTGLNQSHANGKFLDLLGKSDIYTFDISLDLRKKKYNQLPYDSHPNEKAHAHFAQALISVIGEWISSLSPAN